MVSIKAIFAYLFYALLVVGLFLYLLLPEQVVKAYIDERLTDIDPSLTIVAETIRPAIPPGLKMSGVDLNRDGVKLVHVNDARLSPDLTTLLRTKKQARFQAHLADGTIKGRVIIEGADPSGRLQMESDLSQIRLEQIDVVQANERFTLSGVLKGQITHDGGRSTENTSGSLSVSGLRITLKSAFYGISDLVIGQADTTFSVNRQNLKIQSLTFNGPMMEGKITGTIMLRHPFGQSQLNLSGNAKPRPELFAQLQETIPSGIVNARTLGTRGLNFQVRGSVDNPNVSMR